MSERKNINLIPGLALQTLHVSQNDVGRTLVVELFEGSSAYAIPADATVTIEGTKQSTLGFKVTGVISTNSGGIRSVVTFVTTKEMTDEWGEILSEIKVKKDTTQLGTANFVLSVEKDPHPDNTTDGSAEELIPTITALVERIEEAAEKTEVLFEAEAWARGSRGGVDVPDTDDTYHNNSKYYKELAGGSASDAASHAADALASKQNAAASATSANESKLAAEEAKTAAEYAAAQASSVYSLAGDVTFSVDPDDGHVTMWFTDNE